MDVHSGAILIGETVAMGEQQPPGALEVTPLFPGKGRTEGAPGVSPWPPYSIAPHGTGRYNDLGVGQESPGDVSEASVHVHDDVLHFVPVGEGAKIFLNGQGGSVRQDVEHAAIQRVCDDTLKGLAARVALEFVKGEGPAAIAAAWRRAMMPSTRFTPLRMSPSPSRCPSCCCAGTAVP